MPDSRAIIPVILSGGSGTRLWPMSRPERPKQLLALTGDDTMLQLTALRTRWARVSPRRSSSPTPRTPTKSTAQLAAAGAPAQALILEPVGRNTAPAIALAAIAAGGGAEPLLVMPSDHVIADPNAFRAAVEAALPLVEDGWLVTFGIEPDAPETGYGWIAVGELLAGGVHRVARFVEKPPRAEAEAMLAAGGHAWNGGIFLFRADRYLEVLGREAPDMVAAAQAAMDAAPARRAPRIWPDAAAFAASPAGFDRLCGDGKGRRASPSCPVSMGWSDLGSWDALHAISDGDADGNALSGRRRRASTPPIAWSAATATRIALVGVQDLIVVASGNDVLIVPRGRSQEVKTAAGRDEEMNGGLSIRRYDDSLARAFRDINVEWIEAMFALEGADRDVLDDPLGKIIEPGGDILFVEVAGLGIVGTCALRNSGGGAFELTKMGVLDRARGAKAGEFLLRATIARAAELSANPLYLLTNSRCQAAIHLYEKLGFVHDAEIKRDFGARYARCDVAMRYVSPTPPS